MFNRLSGRHNNLNTGLESPTDAYHRLVDTPSAMAEESNGHHKDTWPYEYNGVPFNVDVYDPYHLRTYTAVIHEEGDSERLQKVAYPKILYVHGLSCSSAFFESQASDMAKLGIRSKAINLPRVKGMRNNPEEMWDWQVGAVANLAESMSYDGNEVVIIGHSRGAQLAVMAAKKMVQEHRAKHLAGIMLQGPAIVEAMRIGSVPQGFPLVALAGLNALRGNPLRGASQVREILKVFATNPAMTYAEAQQAITVNISTTILEELKDIAVDIEFARGDEFSIDSIDTIKDLLNRASETSRAAPITAVDRHSTSHMMSVPRAIRNDVRSLADPRLQSGRILSFLQSITPFYSPQYIKMTEEGLHDVHRDDVTIAS